jgi:hypothetical protein
VWDSLVKSGWAEETNEGYISKYNDKELGIVGNVAKSLFKQEPKTVELSKDNKRGTFFQDWVDVEYPSVSNRPKVDDLIKEYDAKFKSRQHSIDITPELKAEVEEGLPLFMIDKMQSDSDVLREGQQPIGSVMSVGLTARERFKISALNRIGAGSDRVVFDLGNDRVLKVAKTARGLYQNSQEGEAYLEGIVPTIIEEGDNYVVVAKASKIKANDTVPIYNNDGDEIGVTTARQMFKELDETPIYEYGKNNVYTSKFQDWAIKYGFMDVLSYEILPVDFKRKANWGYANGRPIHIDAGTFGGTSFIEDYRGKTNMQDADFREAYYRSKQAKKEFQDKDAYAKFSKSNRVALGFAYNNKVYLDPRYARKDTPIHEFGHIWNNIAKERYNDFYQAGLSLIEEEGQIYINEAKSKQPNLKGEQLLEEALAIAIADKGMRLKAKEAAGLLGWLKTFWNTVAGAMNLNVTGEQLQNMTLDEYTTLVAGSLMYGTEIKKQVYNPAKAATPQAPIKEQAPALRDVESGAKALGTKTDVTNEKEAKDWKAKTWNEKQQSIVNELPKKKVHYTEIKNVGTLSAILNNPSALSSSIFKSAKGIYEDIINGKPIRDTPYVNENMQLMDGNNRVSAQVAAGIEYIDVAVINNAFYDYLGKRIDELDAKSESLLSKEQTPAQEESPALRGVAQEDVENKDASRKVVYGNVEEINKIEDKRAAAKARLKGKTPPPQFSIETIPAKNKDVTSTFTNLANIYAQLSSTTDKQERRKLTTEIKSVASSNEMVNYIHTNWQKLKNQLNFETKGNCP